MNTRFRLFARPALALLMLGGAGALVPALAETGSSAAELKATYRQDLDVCNSGRSNQSLSACRHEANAAYAQARRGGLSDDAGADNANRTLRCQVLKGADRQACQARMRGDGTTSGSVAEGGILRELTTVEPAAPAKTPVSPR